jgi:hypothetical protein
MTVRARQLHFGLNVLSAGMHPVAWLVKESDPLGNFRALLLARVTPTVS